MLQVAGRQAPGLLVALDATGPALELDDEEPAFGQKDDVDLGQPPVAVDEGQVDPRAGDPVLGQELTEGVQRCGLRRGGGVAQHHPVRGVSFHRGRLVGRSLSGRRARPGYDFPLGTLRLRPYAYAHALCDETDRVPHSGAREAGWRQVS